MRMVSNFEGLRGSFGFGHVFFATLYVLVTYILASSKTRACEEGFPLGECRVPEIVQTDFQSWNKKLKQFPDFRGLNRQQLHE